MKNQSPLPFVKGHCKTKYNENSSVFAFGQEAASHEAGVSLFCRVRAVHLPETFPLTRSAGCKLGKGRTFLSGSHGLFVLEPH